MDTVKPNVLLVVMESARDDHTPVHGGENALYAVDSGDPKETLLRTGRHESFDHLLSETLGIDLSVETVDPTDENLGAPGYR